MKNKAVLAYTASAFGFSPTMKSFMYDEYLPKLKAIGIIPINPWDLTPQSEVDEAHAVKDPLLRLKSLKELDAQIAKRNIEAILKSDLVIANLDGVDVDSGVAAEIGYAYGLGKKIYGWRGDFRRTGENEGVTINLQVEAFILRSGGKIARSLEDLLEILRKEL